MTPGDIIQSIRELTHGKVTKTDISALLYRHNCFYLLSKLPNSPYINKMSLNQALNRIAIQERYRSCRTLFQQLSIPYAVIKGAVLSNVAYGNPFIRTSGDIDILIRRQDSDIIKKQLVSCGFIQGRVTDQGIIPFTRKEVLFQTALTHQTAPYIKQTNNPLCPYINIDINMDILWGESLEKSNMDLVLSLSEETSLFNITFRKLTPEMEFISLCLHHYKDMNSIYLLTYGSLKLGLFCDIYYYLINVKPNAQIIKDICKTLNVGRYIYVCIYQAMQIFDDSRLEQYLNALDSAKDIILLNTFGLTNAERKAWGISLPERLFHSNLPSYIESLLNQDEKEKIQINRTFM